MKNRKLVISLLIFTILLTGTYALLAANLNITGTATGTGDFKIEFSNYTVSNENKATVTIDPGRTSLTVNANLLYPGDTVTINFEIKNIGSLPAIVDDLVINENSTQDFTIQVVGLSAIEGTILSANEKTTGSIVVTWNQSSTNPNPEDVDFDVNLYYLQAT